MFDGNRHKDSETRRLGRAFWAVIILLLVPFFLHTCLAISNRREELKSSTEPCYTQTEQCPGEGLKASIRAANAAEDMADLAIWQMLFGLLGIYLVARTLQATRDTVREAESGASAARQLLYNERAWLMVTSGDVLVSEIWDESFGGPHMAGYQLALHIRNVGRTPAFNIMLSAKQEIIDTPYDTDLAFLSFDEATYNGPCTTNSIACSAYIEITNYQFLRIKSRDIRAFLCMKVEYNDLFQTDVVRMSQYCFEVQWMGTRANAGKDTNIWQFRPLLKFTINT